MDLIITILPVVTKDLPISPRFTPYNFLSRCKFSTLTTRQPMVEFYLLTFPRFPLRKKEHKSYLGKNRTHDFRTSRCAAYLLDHSGDELHSPLPATNVSRETSLTPLHLLLVDKGRSALMRCPLPVRALRGIVRLKEALGAACPGFVVFVSARRLLRDRRAPVLGEAVPLRGQLL